MTNQSGLQFGVIPLSVARTLKGLAGSRPTNMTRSGPCWRTSATVSYRERPPATTGSKWRLWVTI